MNTKQGWASSRGYTTSNLGLYQVTTVDTKWTALFINVDCRDVPEKDQWKETEIWQDKGLVASRKSTNNKGNFYYLTRAVKY